jgi:exodeoxyribonuclease-3
VALASRLGLSAVQVGIPGAVAPLAERRSISADVAGIRFHTVYAPNGRKVGTRHHEIKLAWLSLFTSWVSIDGLADGAPTVVAGDLNVAPADIDVWEPSRYRRRNLTSPPERTAFDALLASGLIDVVRANHPDDSMFTWWNRRGDFYASDRGWRLDHVLADPATAASVGDVSVDRAERGRTGSSDHAPLLVDIDHR